MADMTAPDKPLHERIAEYVLCNGRLDPEAEAMLREAAEALRKAEERIAMAQRELLKYAVSRHFGKCYLCLTQWSDEAPDIHAPTCALARPGHVTAD